ncbi:MAG: hypothetical protein ABII74_09095 [Elusimicrobiota bacterium]
MDRKGVVALCLAGLCFLSACGKNNNIFGKIHKEGSSSDIASLSADAQMALQDKDWSRAVDYYQQILEQNGANSEALLGYSQAIMGVNNLDLASLIASIIESRESPIAAGPSLDLAAYATPARVSDGNLIPSSLNIEALHTASKKIIDKLSLIVKGQADGVIKYNDTDVNLNLAIALLIYSATDILLYAESSEVITITIDNDYQVDVVVDELGINNSMIDTAEAKLDEAAANITEAVGYAQIVVENLKLKTSSEVYKLKEEFNKTFKQALSDAKVTLEGYRTP